MSKNYRRGFFWTLCLTLVLILSGAGDSRPPTIFIFDLSGQGGFFSLPFPTELRRDQDGKIDVDDFPNPLGLKMVERVKAAVKSGYGYSTGPAIYFKFSGPIGETWLGHPKTPLPENSPLFLMDVDPDSPERGKKFPLMARFYNKNSRWLRGGDNLLAVMPVPGVVLRENTLYAAGVTSDLQDAGGTDVSPCPALGMMAAGKVPPGDLGQKALEVYCPVLASLAETGIHAGNLAALTAFRTGDPTSRLRGLFDGAVADPPVQIIEPLTVTREYPDFYVLEGAALMPLYQEGEYPYHHGKGGTFVFDENGLPLIQAMDRAPFCVTIPKSVMPEKGFPLLMFHHGTSGISTQFVDRGVVSADGEPSPPGTGPAMVMARRGYAMAGAAQLKNQERGGSAGKTGFYNFLNPEAVRDNFLQSSLEAGLFLRMLRQLEIDPALCPLSSNGQEIRFDPDLISSMGQSMGSITQGTWAGIEPGLAAVIPSGHGPYWALQIAEGNQFNLKRLKKKGLGTGEGLLGMDRYHPLLNMLAIVLAPADPFAYEPLYYKRPLPGNKAKHVLCAFGTNDHYFPPSTQNASILSIGLDLAGPQIIPGTRQALEVGGLKNLDYPVRGNRQGPHGPVTAAATQYEELPPPDGHNINFQRHETRYQYSCFLHSLARDGVPTLYAPAKQWDQECGK